MNLSKIFFIIALAFILSSCTVRDDLDLDDNLKDNLKDNLNDNINDNINDNTTTDIYDDNLPEGFVTPEDDRDLTSLRDINNALNRSLTTTTGKRVNYEDKDYLVNEADYYTNTSNSYKKAYDDFTALNLTGEQSDYYNDISNYYKSGYDTYSVLATKYGRFKTADEEKLYRTGEGKSAYEIKQDLKDSYQKALDKLGVNNIND